MEIYFKKEERIKKEKFVYILLHKEDDVRDERWILKIRSNVFFKRHSRSQLQLKCRVQQYSNTVTDMTMMILLVSYSNQLN